MPWKEADLMNVKREFVFKSFNNVTNHNADPSVIGILTPGSEQIINHELTPPCL